VEDDQVEYAYQSENIAIAADEYQREAEAI
jgi:hypothetical protein